MSSETKKEIHINDSPDPVSISGTKIILNQMVNCICKIKLKNGSGTGFFCKIDYDNKNILHFLVTNYHVLDKKYFEENEKIYLLLNDDNIVKEINLKINRKTYFNEDCDISLIEIKENDEIKDFLELDNQIFDDKEQAIYEGKSIYILHYPKGKKAAVSYGLLKSFNELKITEFEHRCSTENGSSGSPILNLETNKVIGIHKEGTNCNFNLGTFLKTPLINFIHNNKYIKNNGNNNIYKNIIFINIKNFENKLAQLKLYNIPKMNVIFKEVMFSRKTVLNLNYGTTIEQMLNEFLKKVNKLELKDRNDKIYFSINLRRIEFGDKTPIEKFFDFNSQPNIDVNYT